jgi:DNA-binding transcriptional LysR family regulator
MRELHRRDFRWQSEGKPLKDIQTLRLYTRVARLGSFSAAARESGMVQSQVSRMIAELEASLGVRLLARTTRAVAPTEAGLEFLARMEPILAALDDAENSVRETGELRGRLRVGMPATMGNRVIIPRLSAFAERHPELLLELLLDDTWQDMVREAVDVGIRVGELPDATGPSRVRGTLQRVVVAAPSYLALHGTPEQPDELRRHRILAGPAASQASSWKFERDGESVAVELDPRISINDTEGALSAAIHGLGVTSTTSWACREELRSGKLTRLFPDWKTASIPVHAYFPAGRATRLSARTFVNFLVEELDAHPI